MKNYMLDILIALDQLFNTFAGGHPDETLSAACYRKQKQVGFRILRRSIDRLFFWHDEHCRRAFLSELENRHLPRAYRENRNV